MHYLPPHSYHLLSGSPGATQNMPPPLCGLKSLKSHFQAQQPHFLQLLLMDMCSTPFPSLLTALETCTSMASTYGAQKWTHSPYSREEQGCDRCHLVFLHLWIHPKSQLLSGWHSLEGFSLLGRPVHYIGVMEHALCLAGYTYVTFGE